MSKQKISTSAIDRISSFSDDILIRILSSLPIEQACVTSILSKRWTHLWCFVPDLDFTKTNWKDQESYSRFEKFVFSVLHSREAAGNHSINTFILDIEYDSSELLLGGIKNIHKWVDIVVKRKVQNIHLYPHVPLNGEETILPKFPMSSILNCTTLVVLRLRWFNLTVVSDLSIRLPSLKTLHLKEIYFHQQRDFMMLLDGCPVLEDLQLSYIYMTRHTHHSLDDFESSSMLRKLNRADITDCECYFPVKSLSNLEFLRIKLSEVCFIIEWNENEQCDSFVFLIFNFVELNFTLISYVARTPLRLGVSRCRTHVVSDTTPTLVITLNYVIFSNY